MAGQQGREMLLKNRNAADDAFETVGGIRTKTLRLNDETVDVTDADSTGAWRELLEGAGVRSASISGGGVFKDSAAEQEVLTKFMGREIHDWQVVVPDLGIFEGLFQMTTLEYAGDHNGEATYSLSLESAGAITFTAA